MFGKKERQLKVDDYIFTSRPDGDFTNIIFGTVTGIDGNRIGVNGFIINPVGLKNKVSQGKAGSRSLEILKEPTSENCIFALIYSCLLYTSPSPRDRQKSRMPSSA